MSKLICVFSDEYRDDVLFALQNFEAAELYDIKKEIPTLFPAEYDDIRIAVMKLDFVDRLVSDMRPEGFSLPDILGPTSVTLKPVKKPTVEVLNDVYDAADTLREQLAELQEEKTKLGRKLEELSRLVESEYRLVDKLKNNRVEEKAALTRIKMLRRDEETTHRHLKALEAKISRFKKKNYEELLANKDILDDILYRVDALKYFGKTENSLTFGCWVPQTKVKELENELGKVCKETCVITVEEPKPGEDVPILLDNPRPIQPFEVLTETYGLPTYNEFDPTIIMAFTFTLIFGIMFADVGYGLLMVLICLTVLLKGNLNESAWRFNMILLYGSLSGIVFGLFFGEFFGGILHLKVWFDVAHNIFRFILLAMFLGSLHITISVFLNIYNGLRSGHIGIYQLSLMLLMTSVMLFFSEILGLPAPASLVGYATQLAIAGAAFMVIAEKMQAFEELMAIVANVISYARVAAVGILHITLATVLTDIIVPLLNTTKGMIVGLFAYVFGVFIILALGAFVAFIHTMRLHYVEFFKRFYSASGKKFSPFTPKRERTYVIG